MRQRSLLVGVIALAVALVVVLRALDLLPDGLYDLIQRAAPALLVFVGLWLLLRERTALGGVIALVLTAALAVNVALIAFSARAGQMREDYRLPITEQISPDVTLLRVDVSLLNSDLNLLLADPAAIEGEFVGSLESEVSVAYVEDGLGSAVLTLRETQADAFQMLADVGRGRLDLALPPELAVDLLLQVDQGTAAIDAGNFDVERLNLTVNRGDARVVLPLYAPIIAAEDGRAGVIALGNGSLTVFAPEDLGLRIAFTSASAASPEVDESRYNIFIDGTIESRSYDLADVVVQYAVSVPGGGVNVRALQARASAEPRE